jgi:hypothetical protein
MQAYQAIFINEYHIKLFVNSHRTQIIRIPYFEEFSYFTAFVPNNTNFCYLSTNKLSIEL